MQVSLNLNNNYDIKHTNFKAGKIRVLDSKAWTEAELRAFANNDEFKNLATKLKKKKRDLFVSIEKNKDKMENRVLNLYSGKNDVPEKLIQKIIGPIWCCVPEKRSLIDNIALFPQKVETLFYREDSALTAEKQRIIKQLEKKGIIVRNYDSWHLSELKALNDNNDIALLTKRPDLKDAKLHFVREFSDFLDGNYIEVYHECSNIGTIFPRNYTYNSSSSITDAIASFESFSVTPLEEIKEQALYEIERFNEKQSASRKSIWERIKDLF